MKLRDFIVLAGVLFVLLLLVLPLVLKQRVDHSREYCRDHMRQIWGTLQYDVVQAVRQKQEPPKQLAAYPAGTVVKSESLPANRLSWFIPVLPNVDKRELPKVENFGKFDLSHGWQFDENRKWGASRIGLYLCPAKPMLNPVQECAATQYVGLAGLGPDGASKSLLQAGAGAFRSDFPTPTDAFLDGLANTVLLTEVSKEPGPWIAGGSATLRDLNPEQVPYLGPNGQFGGLHPDGANFLFADGSSRLLTDRIAAQVLRSLFTLAGGPTEMPLD